MAATPKPVVLTGSSDAVEQVSLSWEARGPRPVSYEVRRDDSAIATLAVTLTSYTDTNVVGGTVYAYQIRSVGGSGSAFSNTVSVTVKAAPQPITSPVLSGTVGDTQCSLSWTAVDNATSYTLQRKTGAGSYSDIATQSILTFSDTGRTNTTTYIYRVKGTNGAASGPWSNEVSLTPQAAIPAAPTLTGTPGNSQNSLDWDAVANATTYRVRRQVGAGIEEPLAQGITATDYIDDTAINDQLYVYKVRGVTAGGVLGALSNPVELTPIASLGGGTPPPEPAIIGYAAVAGVTGGGDSPTVYNCSTLAQLRTAIENSSGPRLVNVTGSNIIGTPGDIIKVSNGNLTIDGTEFTGVLRAMILVRASNIIIKQMAIRPGEAATGTLSHDLRALSFNPPTDTVIDRILVDHCSLAWGPDVVFSAINGVRDVTIQYCVIGPALKYSNDPDHGTDGSKGYGPNITVPAGGSGLYYPERITFYRNLIVMNNKRNFRGHGVDGWDVVNNVLYDWGDKSGHGNPRGANIVNNVYKQGPETTNAEGWDSELFGFYTSYFTNNGNGSVYVDGNIGFDANGDPLDLTYGYASGVKRTTPYAGGPTAASHGALTVAVADAALFTAVVDGAGRGAGGDEDAIDTLIKGHATTGTSDGYYNGAGYSAPHPSW